jgi:hypothetical protein
MHLLLPGAFCAMHAATWCILVPCMMLLSGAFLFHACCYLVHSCVVIQLTSNSSPTHLATQRHNWAQHEARILEFSTQLGLQPSTGRRAGHRVCTPAADTAARRSLDGAHTAHAFEELGARSSCSSMGTVLPSSHTCTADLGSTTLSMSVLRNLMTCSSSMFARSG